MIRATIAAGGRALEARMIARARRIAEAAVASRRLALRGTGTRWRQAGLLWPLFAKDR